MSVKASVLEPESIPLEKNTIVEATHESWDTWFDSIDFSSDFMISRDQPSQQNREVLFP